MNKLKSRKFIVWVIWTILVVLTLIITKALSAEMISWYGAISTIYIGGNIAQKYLFKDRS